MLTPEQVETIKQKLIAQIESTFPDDRKQFAKEQIEIMDHEQLEQFLIKNNLIRTEGGTGKENCVFCSIISENIKSYKIAENKQALAVLEINPLAKGHMIVIPKEHISSDAEIPNLVFTLAKKVSSLIKTKLKPKSIKTESKNILGHEVLNIIPIYEYPEQNKQGPMDPTELLELQELLKKRVQKQTTERKERKKGVKKIVEKVIDFEKKFWLPKRIP